MENSKTRRCNGMGHSLDRSGKASLRRRYLLWGQDDTGARLAKSWGRWDVKWPNKSQDYWVWEREVANVSYEVCPGSILPCSIKKKHLGEKIQDIRNCTENNDVSVPFEVGTLEPHTVLPASLPLFWTVEAESFLEPPSATQSYFPESHQ